MDGPPHRVSCDDDACWVCLEGANQSSGILKHPCACPRGVHAKCLARWQLQSAGREEERFCRFCKNELPDWRGILTPKVPAAPPVMAIVYDGKVVRLQVKPGKEGMEEFQRQVRLAFNLGDDVELDCVFDCRAPGTGEKIKLRGLESYSAAMHCAAVAAGERLAKMAAATGGSGGGSNGGSNGGPRAVNRAQSSSTLRSSTGATSSSDQDALTGPSTAPAGTASLTGSGSPRSASVSTIATTNATNTNTSVRGPLTSTTSLPLIPMTASLPAEPQTLDPSHQVQAQASCLLPLLCSPRTEDGDSCGAAAAASGVSSGRRRRTFLAGFFRSLASSRRLM